MSSGGNKNSPLPASCRQARHWMASPRLIYGRTWPWPRLSSPIWTRRSGSSVVLFNELWPLIHYSLSLLGALAASLCLLFACLALIYRRPDGQPPASPKCGRQSFKSSCRAGRPIGRRKRGHRQLKRQLRRQLRRRRQRQRQRPRRRRTDRRARDSYRAAERLSCGPVEWPAESRRDAR